MKPITILGFLIQKSKSSISNNFINHTEYSSAVLWMFVLILHCLIILSFSEIAKTIFELMIDGDKDPQKIVEEKGLKQESDPKALEALIDKVISDNPDKVKEYKSGKEKLFGFFVGQAMKVSGGKANPQLINDILKKKL